MFKHAQPSESSQHVEDVEDCGGSLFVSKLLISANMWRMWRTFLKKTLIARARARACWGPPPLLHILNKVATFNNLSFQILHTFWTPNTVSE